jgi:hypothetical protein
MKSGIGLISLLVVALMAPAIAHNAGKQVTAFAEKRAGVMARGRWLPEAELKKTLDEIAPRFQVVSGAER